MRIMSTIEDMISNIKPQHPYNMDKIPILNLGTSHKELFKTDNIFNSQKCDESLKRRP